VQPDRDDAPNIDLWFPKLGQCLVCGVAGIDQRHRRIDAIADAVAAGEAPEDVAADMDVTVEAVEAAVAYAAWEIRAAGKKGHRRGLAWKPWFV
jgi:uncharacterized protein (DUF433 family)